MTEAEAILGILSLVDIALTGALVMIVIFSGYENFVSRIDHTADRNWPEWMGSIDFTALKIKLLGSIVAISAIQLLKQFMAVKTASDRDLMWYVGIHLVFVVSSVLLALSDRLGGEIKSKPRVPIHRPQRQAASNVPQEPAADGQRIDQRHSHELRGGRARDGAFTVVLHHPLATNLTIWDELTAALTPRYRVRAASMRAATARRRRRSGPYDFETLAADVDRR